MMGYCEIAVTDLLARLPAALAGRYAIERELGRGGMAHVFLAQDLRHHRPVALKVLRPDLAAALGPERFLREIAVAAQLAHPHILPLLDSGEAGGLLYYVMPYVEGESLRVWLDREQQLHLEDAVRIAREVAGALDYAHRHHVVHRDIKPENILFQEGHALVADFGIARAMSAAGDDRLTQSGLTVGTPSYMSPEQAAGNADVDGRCDIYGLGCVLYEMLAGEPPYTGPTAQAILAKRLSEPVPHLRTLRDVPPAVEQAVTRALARAPADRFATAADFAAALTSPAGAAAAWPASAEQSIAVLPFTNLSPDPENEYFSDGIAEEVINALAQLDNLRVAARTSSFAFKGGRQDLRVIGERLGVHTLLEGSVRRAGDRLRITAQLTNAADGYHLWSERYDREMDDVFAVQDDIARAIVERLRVTLTRPEAPLVRPGTDNVQAYDLYLRGRYFWARRGEGLQKAIDYFERAIAADPDFAAPYAGLADTYCILGLYGYMPSMMVQGRTRDAAERALALDSSLGEAHYSVGLYEWNFGWNLERAEREFRRAIELNARSALPHVWLAMLALALGRREEGLELARRARPLDPLSPLVNALAGLALSFAGSLDEALDVAERAVELEPTFPGSYWSLGWVRAQRGELPGAISALEQAVVYSARSPLLVSMLATAYAQGGRVDAARQLATELEGRDAGPAYLALIYWRLGEDGRAFAHMEQAFAQRNAAAWMLGTVPVPAHRRLAGDPRWVALLKRHGLEALAASAAPTRIGS
jgi:TolB-like protein